MKNLFLALVLCLSSVPAALAQEVVQALSLGSVNMTELSKLPAPPAVAREIEHEGRRQRPEHAESATAAFDFKPTAATIAVPPISTKFSTPGSSSFVPADAAGAVSKNWVVTATNNAIVVSSRSGQQQTSVAFATFLSDLPTDPGGIYTDPRIVYDAGADRWIVWGLRFSTHGLIVVSRTGDPRGEWTRYRITSSQFGGYIDFTRLALTRDTIVAATYVPDGPSFAISIKKSDLYALPPALDTKLYLTPFDAAPVHGEESSVEYVLSDSGSGNQIRVWRLDQLSAAPKVVNGAYPWSRNETPAPQLGSPTRRIDTGFLDIEAAVLRGGYVWVVNAAAATNPVRTYIMWWKFDPETGALKASGVLDDPTGVKFYAYPSIAVNGAGAAMIGYSSFTATGFPSAGYIYIDPTGAVSNEGLLKAGESVTGASRWGDYTTTVVDPTDNVSFWTIQLATAENHWVAWWGKMTPKSKTRSVRK